MSRKTVILALLLCLAGRVAAQETVTTGRIMAGTLASRPACPTPAVNGDVFTATDQNPVVAFICDSVNGWQFLSNVPTLPNQNLSFSATPNFVVGPNVNYTMTLTGNVTSSTTSGTALNGALLGLTLIQDGTGGRTFSFPGNFVLPVGYTFDTTLSHTNALVFRFDGTNWNLFMNAGGGAGTPAGVNGDLQMKSGTAFAASGENDNGTVFKTTRDAQFAGPAPYYDVRAFGARMISGTQPSANATMTSGSAVATLSVASTFQNGDGVVVRGAGPTPTMATPAAPTVTPSNSGTTNMTGSFAANTSGATTYQYQVVAVDLLRGVTVASTATVITNGPAVLGSQTVNISSWTRSNNVVTVTTASPHNLVAGAGFSINPGTDGSIAGAFVVTTAPDNTHFTFSMGLDTRNGASTSGGNTGIITYYMANHVTIASVVGAQMYLIYGRAAGSMTLLGATLPETSFTTDPLYNDWDDYGSTMTAVQLPNWAPTTPPVAVKNQDLVSTILSGAGTTTVTLANTASNNVTTQPILFDNSIALIATMVAARNGAGIVYIPCTTTANGFLILNAVTLLNPSPSFVSIRQCGGVATGDTIKIGQTQWNGERSPAKGGSFAFDQYPNITSSTAYPIIWSAGQWKMSYVSINGSNNGVIWDDDGAGTIPGFQMEHVNMIAGGASDFLSRAFICRTSIIGGSDVLMDHITMVPGTGISATPIMIFTSVPGMMTLSNFMINRRALYFGTNTNGIGPLLIQQVYCQGCFMPKITVENTAGVGNAGVSMTITGSIEDTSNWPVVAVASGGMSGLIKLFNTNGIIGPLTTGSPGPSFQLTNAGGGTQNISDNIGVVNGPIIFNEVDGFFTNNGAVPITTIKQDAGLAIGTPYQAYVNSLAQQAPTCVVSAGGSVSIGAKTFVVFPVFSFGGEGSPSAVSPTCTTSSGQQTVTIGWTVVPGAIGYDIFVNGFSISGAASPMVAGGNSTSFVFSSGGGGQSQPQSSGSGPTVLEVLGIHANKAFLSSTAGTGVATLDPTSITSNHTYTFPDSSGLLVASSGPLSNPVHAITTSGNGGGTINDSGVAPMNVYDSFNRANGTLQAGNANWTVQGGTINISSNTAVGATAATHFTAIYNGSTFPTDDQTARVTLAVTSNTNAAAGVVVRMSTAQNGYSCTANNNTSLITISKITAGVPATLGSGTSYTAVAGDILVLNVTGSTLTCYINGVVKNTQTDATFTSGFPGLKFFSNSAWALDDFMASYGAVSLAVPQTWSAVQTMNRGQVTSTYTNATTTASNITGLSFAVAASTNYAITCQLYYQGSAATAGLDITVTGPASPTAIFYSYDEFPTATTIQTAIANAFATKLVGNATVTATTNLHATVTIGLVNGANAGTVQVQGSATGAGTVTVQAGSFCTVN